MLHTYIRRFAPVLMAAAVLLTAVDAVAAGFTLSPASLAFPTQPINTTSAPKIIALKNTSAAQLKFSLTTTVGDYVVTDSCLETVNLGQTCTLSVTFSPTATGAHPASLVVTDIANAANTLSASLSGSGVLATTVSVTALAFGSVAQSTTSPAKTFVLTNNQYVALTNLAIALSNPDYAASGCPTTIPARGTCTVSVTFTPSAAPVAAENATLTLTHDAVTSPQAVALTGTSVAATVVTVSTLAFGNVARNDVSPAKTFTITNNQSIPLTSIAFASSNTDFAATGCTAAVAPHTSCIVSVRFTPSAAPITAEVGTLTITHSALTSPQTISLTGSSIFPTTVSASTVAFGNVVQNTVSAVKTFTLTNHMYVPLNNVAFSSSNADFSAFGCPNTIAPKTSCTVSVTFAPLAAPVTAETGTLTISHSAFNSPQTVNLTGTSVLPFSVSATSLIFASTVQGTSRALSTLTVRNNQLIPLNSVVLATAVPFDATGCASAVPPGGTCAITVTFSPTAVNLGTVTGSLMVSSTDPTATNRPIVALRGTAVVPATATPSPLVFGNQTVATTSAGRNITIRNNQAIALTFSAPPFTLSGPAAGDYAQSATTCGPTLAPAATCTVTLTFHPTRGGARSAAWKFNVANNAIANANSLALTGTGTTPITISPVPVAFGSVGVGLASAGKLLTLQNNESIPVNIASIAPPTGDFVLQETATTKTTCGAVMAPSSSCTISLVMTPKVGGPRTGSIVITDNSTTSPHVIALTGTGINAVTASVSALTFASQKVNTTSISKQVILTNHQIVPVTMNMAVTGNFAATDSCGGVIPALATCVASVTFTPLATGTLTGALSVASPGGADRKVTLSGTGTTADPPPTIANVSPGAGTVNTTIPGVIVTGKFTRFTNGTPTVSFGAGVTPSSITVISDTKLVVGSLAIATAATPGSRTVQVTNAGQTASLTAGFVVSASSALSFSSIAPNVGVQGQTLNVGIVGINTHFQQGVTFANFGDNVFVNGAVQIADPTHATANVTVSPTAALGWRAVTIVTGGEYATLSPTSAQGPGFDVVSSNAAIVSVAPPSGVQGGSPFVATVNGANTHFLQNASQVSFGAGINVGNVQVIGPAQLQATIAVTAGATAGPRDVIVMTGGENAALGNAFSITPSATIPYLSNVTPSSGHQGETLSLTLTGVNTQFTQGTPTLDLGSNITINALTVNSDTSIAANISIDLVADASSRLAVLASNGTDYTFTFTVTPSVATIINVSPANGPQNQALTITVTGLNTHWIQGTTNAWFSPDACGSIVVNRVTINSATSADLDVTISAHACLGTKTFQLATGGEVVSAAFGVYATTPSLMLSPSTGKVGTTLTVNFVGQFSHFGNGASLNPTIPVIDGAGIDIQNFAVTSPTSATATFVIDPTAIVGPCYPTRTPGCHLVTLTTPLAAGGDEILTADFQVTDTPAMLMTIAPFHAAPDASATVTITGANTHFAAGVTTVAFGPDISVSGLTVIDPTTLSVNVALGSTAALGWRYAYVNTGAEQLTIGFLVDSPAAPAIASVSPSDGAQGQSLTVTITGQNTSINPNSELILGAGVTVSQFTVTSPTTATAVVAISPTAPIGPNTVIVITPLASGDEIASGLGFSVTRGPSQILSVSPNTAAQTQTLNVVLTGQATHWLQGASSADFGSGVHVDQLTVQSPMQATAEITVLSTATLGFHAVSVLTDGEFASMAQGLTVVQGTPVLLSSSPNAGRQATTFDVQVLGQFTHWQQGITTASYGNGVIVNALTVVDSRGGVMNVTVDPLAYVDPGPCHSLTVTTGTEQVGLANQLCVQPGAAIVTAVNPNNSPQGRTLTVAVTGQSTHFAAGLTTADFGPGINASNVTVTGPTTASVDLAVTMLATNGFHTATLRTLGETASMSYAFTVGPTTPTLNGASPSSGQQAQSLTVHLIGQYTHWSLAQPTVTFGQGIAVNGVTVLNDTAADVAIIIDPLAYIGSRLVTVAMGGEIVSGNVFAVTAGPAIISDVQPESGNQGQEILMSITGQFTHWSQGQTQFSMGGLGQDIKMNYFLVNGPTSATADLTISPTAALGARSIYMVTAGESLVDANAFIVTGGIPAIASVSPGSGKPGDTNLNVQIAGLFTQWVAATTVDFGPGVTVQNYTVNNSTSITAVVNIDVAAGLGQRIVAVRTGNQVLNGFFQVVSSTPPTPLISYLSPYSGLAGQTLTIDLSGLYTHWDPATSAIDFGDPTTAGITLNSFQVTSPTSARANVTIVSNATPGPRTLEVATGTELEQTTFSVVIATPAVSIVDPAFGMQGATMDVNVIGQYTTFDNTTTFDFGPDVTVNSINVLGPTIAQVNITVDELAPQTFRGVRATTGVQVANSLPSVGFFVKPSQAVIASMSPNAAKQGDTLTVQVIGQNTHWDASTAFSFGGGIGVTSQSITSPTTATLTISIQALAAIGPSSITATTGGEIASLVNAFVVQIGTPLVLSSGPPSGQQQQTVSLTILGQFTQWANGNTTVDLGNGVAVTSINVTSPEAITVGAQVQPLAMPGYRTITVTTGAQVLTLVNGFYVTNGPAAIAQLSPDQGGQSVTLDVTVIGAATHLLQGVTVANFGPGISANSVTVTGPTAATVNITIAANANPGQNSVTLSTLGESASAASAFTILLSTPSIQFVSPASGAQSATLNVTVFGLLTNFTNATVFDFGPGITVNSATIVSAIQASVNMTIAPTAARTTRNVSATTGGVTVSGLSLFTVTAGPAYISAVAPIAGRQNQTGLSVAISGNGTHFTAAAPNVNLGSGVTVTQIQVISDTFMTATVNISPSAPVQFNDVIVTTAGEVATLATGFRVQAGVPTILSASPLSAHQADTIDVAVNGLYTSFAQGLTAASFGAGITVNLVTVFSATQATVNITIDPSAGIGSRTLTITTGAQTATGVGAFTVVGGLPHVQSLAPNLGAQGSTQTVTITGLFTNFQGGVSQVSFSSGGVTTGTVTVNGPTQIQVPVTVTQGAPAGPRTVTVTTGGEVASLTDAFTVQPGLPAITVIDPNVGVANSTVNVTISGQFTHFAGSTQANFGAGISVNGAAQGAFGTIAVSSATTAVASLTIDAAAAAGPRNITVVTGGEVLNVNSGFTVQTVSPTAPVVTFYSPAYGATGVPINTEVAMLFSAPIDRNTVSAANIRVMDTVTQGYCWYDYSRTIPGTVNVDASGRVVTFTPSAVLAVGRQYYVCVNYGQQGTANGIQDPSGNQVSTTTSVFTTGFATDNSGPSFIAASIADGDMAVPTNAPIVLGFTKPIDPITAPDGLTVMNGGSLVPGTFGYTPDYKQITFVPAAGLSPNATYVVGFSSALEDSVGNGLANPGTFTFTTAAGPDFSGAVALSYTPAYGAVTGLTPTIAVLFNKALNPLSIANSYLYTYLNGTYWIVPWTSANLSADRKTVTLALSRPLSPGVQYSWLVTAYDRVGNYASASANFVTGTSVDATGPTVLSVSPPDGSVSIAVNAPIEMLMSERIDPTAPAILTMNPAVAAGYVLGADGMTLTFTPASLLAPSTTYSVTVSAARDLSGNMMTPYSWSFTTSASPTPDTTPGTISVVPTSGAIAVPAMTPVVASLSKPVDPGTVNAQSFRVYDNTAFLDVAGSIAIAANDQTLTFTPLSGYVGGHQICVYVSYNAFLNDWAGNHFNYVAQCFMAAPTVDATPPQVVSVAPFNNATGLGPFNPVTITFSEAISRSSLLSGSLAIFSGTTLVTASPSFSSDGTMVTFSNSLQYGTTYTVAIGTDVTDLSGNHLPALFTSTFTTAPAPVTARPQVIAFRPGAGANGVDPSNPVTFFLDHAIDPATVGNSLYVSQNGVLITGATVVTGNNRVVTFRPSVPFQRGSLVAVWFTSAATDAAGNRLYDYQTSFTIAPDLSTTPATVISAYPYGATAPINTAIAVRTSKPIDPATVTASSFYLTDCNSNPVTTTIALSNQNTLLRLIPTANLGGCGYFYYYLTSQIQDVDGLALQGIGQRYFYISGQADLLLPAVVGIAPTDNASGIGVNSTIRVTFNKSVETGTVDATTVSVTSGGNAIPYTFTSSGNSDGTMTLTLTPQAPLPMSAPVSVTVNGVSDFAGRAAAPASVTFSTAAGPDFSTPTIVATNVGSGDSNVPVTSVFTLTFDRPMDTRTFVYGSNIYLSVYTPFFGYQVIPSVISFNTTRTQVTVAPISPLAVNRQYQLQSNAELDLAGNSAGGFGLSFTTALFAASGGPQVVLTVPADVVTGVPVNIQPAVTFDRVIAQTSLAGVTLMANGSALAFSATFSNGDTLVRLSPASILQPDTDYVLTIAGVTDTAGTPMAAPVVVHFHTSPTTDLVGPSVLSYTPPSGAFTGTKPVIRMRFNEPIDPIRSSSIYILNYGTGHYLTGVTPGFSADRKTLTIQYPGQLDPTTSFLACWGYVYDLAGNYQGPPCTTFYTGFGPDTAPFTVVDGTPAAGATGLAVNALVSIRMNKAIDPTSLAGGGISLTPAAGGTMQLSSDGLMLSYQLSANLAANTTYTINASGFGDLNGNAVTPFSSAFTTAGIADTSHGTIGLTSPAPGSSGVSVNSSITVTLSEPVDPLSVVPDAFVVFAQQVRLAGSIGISANGSTLTFTPQSPLPPSTLIHVYAAYFATLLDLAGNNFQYLYDGSFTTAAVADTTAPQVISVTPSAGMANVGPNATVTLTFSKSLDPSTVNGTNFALYSGYTNLGASVSHSADNRMVMLNRALPYGTTITVVAGTGVQDVAGNALAAQFRSTFATLAPELFGTPTVTQMRPTNSASNVPLDAVITLFTSAPLNPASLTGAFAVSQNGVLMTGGLTADPDGFSVVFTPGQPFTPGALIEVFLTNAATDTAGNKFGSFAGGFRVAADSSGSPLQITGRTPNGYSVPTNTIVDVQFNKPIDPAYATTSYFYLTDQFGVAIASTATQLQPNVLRLVPNAPLTPNAYTYSYVAGGMRAADGTALGATTYTYFYTAAGPDSVVPAVQQITPYTGSTNIGDNAAIRVVFNKLMDDYTINASTISLTSGGTPIPFSVSFEENTRTLAIVTPQAPLPDNASVTLSLGSGVSDQVGQQVPTQSVTFQTGNGPDMAPPLLVFQSPDPSQTSNVPTNATFTWVFNEPLDPTTVDAANVYVNSSTYPYPRVSGTPVLSPDGKTITVVPASNLDPNAPYTVCAYSILDLNRNANYGGCRTFTTGSSASATAPHVVATNPLNSATGAATNSLLEIVFDKPVSTASLSQITITANGAPVPFYAALTSTYAYIGQTVVQLWPSSLLDPNTTYTVTIAGVQDLAGIAMSAPYTSSFTTGADALLTTTSFASATVMANGVQTTLINGQTVNNVDAATAVTLTFSDAVDIVSILNGGAHVTIDATNTPVPVTVTMSPDGRTATLTPQSPLAAGTQYRLEVHYSVAVYDQAGKYLSGGGGFFRFVTP